MNKKGDVPVTILVVGVFALCSLAMLTFFMADFKMGNSFVGVSIMEKMDATIDEYYFHINNGVDSAVVKGFFPTLEVQGRTYLHYSKNVTSYFGISSSPELSFSVRYPIG